METEKLKGIINWAKRSLSEYKYQADAERMQILILAAEKTLAQQEHREQPDSADNLGERM